MFNDEQLKNGKSVCIIGPSIKSKFFPKEDPIGKEIKCGHIWLKVIGVLKKRPMNQSAIEDLGISDYNNSIYAPIQTLLLRFKDRSLITSSSLRGGSSFYGGDFAVFFDDGDAASTTNQIDKIVVQVRESEQIGPSTEILKRMMKRRHGGVDDFEIKVPELLLKQEQRTKDIFNIVLGAIASISLIVGGIGIMNIMFASVMERIKEIGTRMAIGAKKMDIVVQFLSEAVLISVSGGFVGVFFGVVMSKLIEQIAGIMTIVSFFSVFIAFGVSAAVGVIFGYSPAKRASEKDPIESLRYE